MKWTTFGYIPKEKLSAPIYHVLGHASKLTGGGMGYYDNLIEAKDAINGIKPGYTAHIFVLQPQETPVHIQSNAIPTAKLDGPLVAVINHNGIVALFDDLKEAETKAAEVFVAGNGKTPVMIFEMTKLAKPATPKVDFQDAKKA